MPNLNVIKPILQNESMMRKNIICTPRKRESLLEIILRLITGRKRNLRDWVEDHMI